MKIKELLLEYNRAITSTRLGAKLIEKFRKERTQAQVSFAGGTELSDQQLVNTLLDRLETADTTRTKLYVPWMIQTYIRDLDVKFEDLVSTIADSLSKYYQLTQRRLIPSPYNNIDNIKTANDLFQLVTQHSQNQLEKKQVDKGRSVEIYNDDQVRVIQPLDEKASCYYGQGTQWCTAATISTNRFDQYNKSGPLYVVIPKKPSYNGEKYQIHFEEYEFTNEQNKHFELTRIISKFPQLKKVFGKKATEYGIFLDPNHQTYLDNEAKEFLAKNKNLLIKIAIDRIYKEYPSTTNKTKIQNFLSSEFDDYFATFVYTIGDIFEEMKSQLNFNYPISEQEDVISELLDESDWNSYISTAILPVVKASDPTPPKNIGAGFDYYEELLTDIYYEYRKILAVNIAQIFEKILNAVNYHDLKDVASFFNETRKYSK